MNNVLNILFDLQIVALHHRIVQFADNLNILVSLLFFLQSFLVVQYLTMENFQVNFTVRIICLSGTKYRNLRGWYCRFQLFEMLMEVPELLRRKLSRCYL